MKKVVIALVVLVLLLPILAKLRPEALTFERIHQALLNAGFTVTDMIVDAPTLDAIAQVTMTVNGWDVNIYKYNDYGKIARNYEFQKPDTGSAIVEAWNLSETLGAPPPSPLKTSPGKNGLFLLTITSADPDLRAKVVQVFESL